MKKKASIIIGLIVIILLVAETITVYAVYANSQKKDDKIREQQEIIDEQNSETFVAEEIGAETRIKVLTEEMDIIGELSTVEYLYTDATHFTDARKIKGFKLPLTKKSVLAKWSGTIKAGIKVEKISITEDEKEKIIIVTMPHAEVFSNEVDEDSFETLDEDDGFFNKVTVDDTVNLVEDTKDDMNRRAISAGLLEKAENNAKQIITDFLQVDENIKDNYKIEFEIIDNEGVESDTE